MDALTWIGEHRIREAIARGELDELPLRGRPLPLEDLSRVPEELRAGYLLLRGAGFAPEELELRRDCLQLRDLLRACSSPARSGELRERLRRAELRLAILLGDRVEPHVLAQFGETIAERLAR